MAQRFDDFLNEMDKLLRLDKNIFQIGFPSQHSTFNMTSQ